MDALIIAAGFGSRLNSIAPCKPLVRIAGAAMIELGIRRAMSVGVRRVVVATGYRAQELEAALALLGAALDVPIIPARVADWSKPNGYSVLAGAAHISGDYLLMMADHLFERALIKELVTRQGTGHGVTLAIDQRTNNPLIDPDDATFVRSDSDGRIIAIGKHLADHNAVDCGAFLANAELAEAIKAAISAGRPGSLTDGMQELARLGRAVTFPIGERWWIDVDDPAMHELAEEQAPQHLADLLNGLAPII
jgi:1L-myo-inositol 1-phosphate cytidylyltransferase